MLAVGGKGLADIGQGLNSWRIWLMFAWNDVRRRYRALRAWPILADAEHGNDDRWAWLRLFAPLRRRHHEIFAIYRRYVRRLAHYFFGCQAARGRYSGSRRYKASAERECFRSKVRSARWFCLRMLVPAALQPDGSLEGLNRREWTNSSMTELV